MIYLLQSNIYSNIVIGTENINYELLEETRASRRKVIGPLMINWKATDQPRALDWALYS